MRGAVTREEVDTVSDEKWRSKTRRVTCKKYEIYARSIYWIINVILIVFFTYVAIITIYPRPRKAMPLGLGIISRKWAIRFALLLLIGVMALVSSILQSTQALGRPLYPIDGDETAWSFGQTLPLLFLSLPFLTALEVFGGMLFSYFCLPVHSSDKC
jgi:hypothetical protein